VAVITGAGRGIGREHALLFAAEGAQVVVNDLGGSMDGRGSDGSAAAEVVEEIRAAGGDAVANTDDVSSWEGGEHLIKTAIDAFGDLHVLVNNAGILRDRVLVNMSEAEWDAVVDVHMKGHFVPTRWAAAYWREQTKAGRSVAASVINTSSTSGLLGNPGQSNYGAAKAGIAAFTQIAAQELARYGVTVNAVAPGALTRLTDDTKMSDDIRAHYDPRWVAPLVTWLASSDSRDVSGQVIESNGLVLAIAEGWHRGPSAPPPGDPAEVGPLVRRLLEDARPHTRMAETV